MRLSWQVAGWEINPSRGGIALAAFSLQAPCRRKVNPWPSGKPYPVYLFLIFAMSETHVPTRLQYRTSRQALANAAQSAAALGLAAMVLWPALGLAAMVLWPALGLAAMVLWPALWLCGRASAGALDEDPVSAGNE